MLIQNQPTLSPGGSDGIHADGTITHLPRGLIWNLWFWRIWFLFAPFALWHQAYFLVLTRFVSRSDGDTQESIADQAKWFMTVAQLLVGFGVVCMIVSFALPLFVKPAFDRRNKGRGFKFGSGAAYKNLVPRWLFVWRRIAQTLAGSATAFILLVGYFAIQTPDSMDTEAEIEMTPIEVFGQVVFIVSVFGLIVLTFHILYARHLVKKLVPSAPSNGQDST